MAMVQAMPAQEILYNTFTVVVNNFYLLRNYN